MRTFLLFVLIAVLVTVVSAWTKEDHEIFDLVSALEAAEGKGTTFYSWLEIPHTASLSEINKAYRKKSMQLHPDKNPGVKGIQERFARLGLIGSILRSSEGRERYNFFYKNGVPRWRGTGYYYARFRPGIGTVLVFLTVLSSILQYVIQRINYSRDLERVDHFMREARMSAWGPKMQPSEGRRKVKVKLGGPPRLDDEGNHASGKFIDMIVEGNDVFILDPSGEMHPLNRDSAVPPALTRTWFISLVKSAYDAITQRISPRQPSSQSVPEEEGEGEETDDISDTPGNGIASSKENGHGEGAALKAGHAATAKAGGRRRKAVRKR